MQAVLLALLLGQAAAQSAACTMTDTGGGSGLFKIEMHSLRLIQPFEQIHCGFSSADPLISFNGSDPSAPSQCDSCIRSSSFSCFATCKCPLKNPPDVCQYHWSGFAQFPRNSSHLKTCYCDSPGPPAPPHPPAPPPPCKAKIDVVIILDGSASIVSTDWTHALNFSENVVDAFNVSADQVNVGAVQFSETANIIVPLSADAAAVKAAIARTVQMKEVTNTYAGFDTAKTMLTGHKRPGTKGQIVLLITDGEQNQGQPAKIVSDQLKQAGVEIFGIAVGSSIGKQHISQWVSAPVSDHLFQVTGFSSLDRILNKCVQKACHPHPPSPSRTTLVEQLA